MLLDDPFAHPATTAETAAFTNFIASGGGVATAHGSTATDTSWALLVQVMGGTSGGHPSPTVQTMTRLVADHPSTRHLPLNFGWKDEWVSFHLQPGVVPLVQVGGNAGLTLRTESWYLTLPSGTRSFRAAQGHYSVEYQSNELFRKHLFGGILWAAKAVD